MMRKAPFFIVLLITIKSVYASDLDYSIRKLDIGADIAAYTRPVLGAYTAVDALMVDYFVNIKEYERKVGIPAEHATYTQAGDRCVAFNDYSIWCKTEYGQDKKDITAYTVILSGLLQDAPQEARDALTKKAEELSNNGGPAVKRVFFDDMTDTVGFVRTKGHDIAFGLSLRLPKQDQNRAMLVKYLAHVKRRLDSLELASDAHKEAQYFRAQVEAENIFFRTFACGDMVVFKRDKKRQGIYELMRGTDSLPFDRKIISDAYKYIDDYRAGKNMSSYAKKDVQEYRNAMVMCIPYFTKRAQVGNLGKSLQNQKKYDEQALEDYKYNARVFNVALKEYYSRV